MRQIVHSQIYQLSLEKSYRQSSQDKDAKFSDFPFNFIELISHSEIYLCQGSSQHYSYGAENISLVRAEAMHGKSLLLLLLSSVPAGVKPFRNRQIANLLVHWTELALISLFTHPTRQNLL